MWSFDNHLSENKFVMVLDEPAIGKPPGVGKRVVQEGEFREEEQEPDPQQGSQDQRHRSPAEMPPGLQVQPFQRKFDQQGIVNSKPGTQKQQGNKGYENVHDQRPSCSRVDRISRDRVR